MLAAFSLLLTLEFEHHLRAIIMFNMLVEHVNVQIFAQTQVTVEADTED